MTGPLLQSSGEFCRGDESGLVCLLPSLLSVCNLNQQSPLVHCEFIHLLVRSIQLVCVNYRTLFVRSARLTRVWPAQRGVLRTTRHTPRDRVPMLRGPGTSRLGIRAASARAVSTRARPHNELLQAYSPPAWVGGMQLDAPTKRLQLGHLPTPMHRWDLPRARAEVWIKRDDCTGCELSGNKVRKLEFLLAAALESGCEAVVTVGGIQSNHCRATAAAARRVGLEPHLILRVEDGEETQDPGLVGNLLINRMVGARMHLVSASEFEAVGGWELCQRLQRRLAAEGRTAYAFPSGGSSALGTWGYVEAVRQMRSQTP